MYITKFQVGNYKSYYRPDPIDLKKGFNIIVGQNNCGKSVLLQALSLDIRATPHRSEKTIPSRGVPPTPTSRLEISFSLSNEELRNLLLVPNGSFFLPKPKMGTEFARSLSLDNSTVGGRRLIDWFLSQEEFIFTVRFVMGADGSKTLECPVFPTFGVFEAQTTGQNQAVFVQCQLSEDKTITSPGETNTTQAVEVGFKVATSIASRIYRFTAERSHASSGAIGNQTTLLPDGSNLAQVLHNLQVSNPARFHRFNVAVNQVLPQIKYITVPAISNNNEVRIKLWPIDPATERDDLTVGLEESGTGVGQVLAILYVVMNANTPQTILIDEPQSFLHPGAVRKLVEILKTYPQHQFVIATHSPTVITAADPETITMVRIVDGESVLEKLDATQAKDLKMLLAEVGASFSDVFGADKVLWVEGDTEARCFPRLLEKIEHEPLMGAQIVPLRNTGELQRKDADRIIDIYNRLTRSGNLIPQAIGFILDTECKEESEQADLKKRSSGKIHFIPRRMYENYLLSASAIANIANTISGFRKTPVTEDEVGQLIEAKRHDAKYFCQGSRNEHRNNWVINIDAAKLLNDIFSELSENRVIYHKVEHSVALTEWIIEHAPEDLKELSEMLVRVLNDDQ